jgi:hypothetical protein
MPKPSHSLTLTRRNQHARKSKLTKDNDLDRGACSTSVEALPVYENQAPSLSGDLRLTGTQRGHTRTCNSQPISRNATIRLVDYVLARVKGETPDRLEVDRLFLSPGALDRLEHVIPEALAFDAACEENSVRLALAEIGDLLPESICVDLG